MQKRMPSKLGCAPLVAAVACIAGCAQPVRVADSMRLKEDEGVIVYRMTCEEGVAWGEFFESGRNSQGYLASLKRSGALLCQPGYQTQRLRAGRYFIGKIGFQTHIDLKEEDAMKFTVVAQRLNYIGDIYVPTKLQKLSGRRLILISDPNVSDERRDAVAWLEAEQPRLRSGYEVAVELAQARTPSGRQ